MKIDLGISNTYYTKMSLLHLITSNKMFVFFKTEGPIPLVPLVDLVGPDDEHERGHDGQVVGEQVGQA